MTQATADERQVGFCVDGSAQGQLSQQPLTNTYESPGKALAKMRNCSYFFIWVSRLFSLGSRLAALTRVARHLPLAVINA